MLLGISKRGDTYVVTLLIHGARAVIWVAERKVDRADNWLVRLTGPRNTSVTAVTLAKKNARTVWARLSHARDYQADYEKLQRAEHGLPTGVLARQRERRVRAPVDNPAP